MSENNLDYRIFEYPSTEDENKNGIIHPEGDGKAVEAILRKYYSEGQCREHRYRVCKIIRRIATETFGFKPFCEYNKDEWLTIINKIESIEAGVRRKKQYIYCIKKIIGYYIWADDRPYQQSAEKLLTALFPPEGGYSPISFSETGEGIKKKSPMDQQNIIDIFNELRASNIQRYMEFAGLLFGAARISSWLAVVEDNINYDEFTIDVISKRTVANTTGMNTLYLVEPFVSELKLFFEDLKEWNSDRENLPVYHRDCWQQNPPITYLSGKQVRKNFKKLFGDDFHPHSGRFTTSGLWQTEGMPLPFRQKMLNHSIEGITLQFYSPILNDPYILKCVAHTYFPYKALWPKYNWEKWETELMKNKMFQKMKSDYPY